jgi:cysteinyl-tRNA synthetase
VVGRANIYVCGVTPYDVTHLGHAATFVWVDAVDRVLRRLGVQVEVCRNITDVDDVLFEAAAKAGAQYERFAAVQQFHFDQDMTALSVRKPMHEPRAHTFITPVIDLAQSLLDNGHAYEAGGSVFLHGAPVATSSDCDEATAEALLRDNNGRLDDPNKRHPFDQAVWQASGPDEPAWPSPWGPGRPGWHAECTAMALSTFGPSLDLHAGGADLKFPHHAFEAAQAEAATGVHPFARAWMHVGTVKTKGEKMAKSTGNLVFVADLIERSSAAAVRLLLLDRRYDEAWDHTDEGLAEAMTKLEQLHSAAGRSGGKETAERAVLDALADDLDVSKALSIAIEEGGQAARDLVAILAL